VAGITLDAHSLRRTARLDLSDLDGQEADRSIWLSALASVGPLPGRRPDRAWFRPSSWKDIALAVVLCAVTGFTALADAVDQPNTVTAPQVAAFLLALIPLVLLAWRPRLCEWLLLVAVAIMALDSVLGRTGDDFTLLVGVYTIGTMRSWRRTGVAVLLTVAIAMAVQVAVIRDQPAWLPLAEAFTQLIVYGSIAGVGLWLGRRRAYVRNLVQRTQSLEHERQVLERERDLMTQRAVAVERARIARELHDVVAHHVSVMVIQAGAAQSSLPPGAEATGQALEAIRETGREAMAEMRRLLGLLRSEESLESGPVGGDTAARLPQPGMTDLESLATRTRDAGVDVALEVAGRPRHIPPGVELSVYRVAQEALTNTLRHAGPGARATLRLVFEPGYLTIEVTDDGRGKPSVESMESAKPRFGLGLVGMRERVALFGGQLETGPMSGGGYRVMARFPLDEGSESNGESSSRETDLTQSSEVRR